MFDSVLSPNKSQPLNSLVPQYQNEKFKKGFSGVGCILSYSIITTGICKAKWRGFDNTENKLQPQIRGRSDGVF